VQNSIFSTTWKTFHKIRSRLVNEKDLEQVVAVREFGIKYLVSYDKHFESIEEYRTPKQFAEFLGLQTHPVNY
jgi:predicted nucleic acid-binding protein